MLEIEKAVLIVIDVQGKLAQLMHEKDALFENIKKTIKGMQALEVPILWLEQCPDKLGPTITEIRQLLDNIEPISKTSFSACQNETFAQSLKATNRSQAMVLGIEAHICVYQTAVDLIDQDYDVEVISDGVSSRVPENKQVGLQRMQDAGVRLTSTEMALFELLKGAEAEQFKEIIKIIT